MSKGPFGLTNSELIPANWRLNESHLIGTFEEIQIECLETAVELV